MSCSDRLEERGFTLVELVTILLILGILAAVAIPKMTSGDEFITLEFRDQVRSSLRYAQKSAVSHRRLVCVSFTASSVTFMMAKAKNVANCDENLRIPGAGSHVVSSRNPAAAAFSPVPAAFSFQPDGSAVDRSIIVAGQPAITVFGATGYVR